MNRKPFGSKEKRGFALVLTLALISFVFMLVMSMVTQVRSELSFSDARQTLILAKAHARMGMMIAIGEIQKHLGPDMRVSTTADIYDERVESSVSYQTQQYPQVSNQESVDLDEDNAIDTLPLGQRMWTGVWRHRGQGSDNYLNKEGYDHQLATRDLPFNSDKGNAITQSWAVDTSYDHHPAIEQAWLVSGNEGWQKKLSILDTQNKVKDFIEVPDGIYIDDGGVRMIPGSLGGGYGKHLNAWKDHQEVVIEELKNYAHPLIALPNPDDDDSVTWILKQPVTKSDGSYAAEPVKVPKTEVNLTSRKNSGKYAYWVGDQGVLSKVNIPGMADLNYESRLAVASSPNFNFSGLDFGKSENLVSLSSLPQFQSQTDETGEELASHYHDFTCDSFGLLVDIRTGGLRRDLSMAFAADKGGALWKDDFKNNWVFRDRVQCEKNFPMYLDQSKKHFVTSKASNTIHKNQWFDEEADATVQDYGALLAGPQWSVLADYHDLAGSSSLSVAPPSQFPRMVGDNALIFKPGESPRSPGGAFPRAANRDTLKYFNCFKDRFENSVRPEPENHPIAPVLTRVKFGMFPAIANQTTNEVAYALNPHVSLWNPYDKPMELTDLYLYLPMSAATIHITQFDPREYDLFRKWWMFVSDDNTIKSKKDLKKPWPLYAYSLFSGPDKTMGKVEMGILKREQIPPGSPYGGGMSGMELEVRQRVVDGQNRPVNVFLHQNPRAGTGEFFFTTWKSTRLQNKPTIVKDVYLKLEDTTLGPGETASFNVTTLQEMNYQAGQVPEILLGRGAEEEAFLLNTGIKDFVFGSVDQTFAGVTGLPNSASDDFVVQGSSFIHSPASSFLKPCLTLYQWEGGGSDFDPLDQQRAKKLSTITQGMAELFIRDDQVVPQTRGTLLQNWEDRAAGGKLPVVGWKMEVLLPGTRRNERVTLVDFNLRHLVHSTQQGMGSLIPSRGRTKNLFGVDPKHMGNGTADEAHMPFKSGREELFVTHTAWSGDDEKEFPFTNKFDIPDETFATMPAWGNHAAQKDLGFPDLYVWPGWPNGSFPADPNDWTVLETAFSQKNNTSDINARALALGFSMGPDANLLSASNYPDSLLRNSNWQSRDLFYAPVPIWDDSENSVGFFTKAGDVFSGQSMIQEEKRAVVFEVPKAKPLSLLQYRHANLNSYLHGPSYALGNSYATTQVARHRPWGRVQAITAQPTSDFGLTSVKQMMDLHDRYVQSHAGDKLPSGETLGGNAFHYWGLHDWGPDSPNPESGKIGVSSDYLAMPGVSLQRPDGHHIDRNEGFAPWRKNDSGSQFNHQNTTIDHSFYLNRALLDGFFLSGAADDSQPADEQTATFLGQRYQPFLYDDGNGQKKGNHRLVAYHRDGQTSASSDEVLRYQSLAGDLLVDGAFNVNSTSVDAWTAQLASLRGEQVKRANGTSAGVTSEETPVLRFLEEPDDSNTWNQFRKLSDEEIAKLAKAMVKQVKLRGPFLSFSDFVNRRLIPGPEDPDKGAGSRVNFVTHELLTWNKKYPENRDTVTGLRGAVQSAIADAGLNDPGGSWPAAGLIPKIPSARFAGGAFNISPFGLHASSIQTSLGPGGGSRYWGRGEGPPNPQPPNVEFNGGNVAFRFDKYSYNTTDYGEAPENLLAVEHMASAANKPGWVMQGDLLSPLAPVSSARSDTFTVRIMGESNPDSPARAWIEVVVQRTPDYIKSDLDAPTHRPHEPFKDENFNGYWDNGYDEEWIDLNRNGDIKDYPDLPGESESNFRDGMISDLRLNLDRQEEDPSSELGVSFQGINQRFGRKFKIVRFRWMNQQDV